MRIRQTPFKDVYTIEPKVHRDGRGHFFESYNENDFFAATGLRPAFVQNNCSRSARGVLRGLHYQVLKPQGKLIRVSQGTIFDVIVDLRRSSPDFGNWFGIELSARNRKQLWIPKGFAHGFLATSSAAVVNYSTTDFYDPGGERTLQWNDPAVNIAWPLDRTPILSDKDNVGVPLRNAEVFD